LVSGAVNQRTRGAVIDRPYSNCVDKKPAVRFDSTVPRVTAMVYPHPSGYPYSMGTMHSLYEDAGISPTVFPSAHWIPALQRTSKTYKLLTQTRG